MRVKAIRDLAQRADDDFFGEVATGLDYIAQNAISLEDEAWFLSSNRRARGRRLVQAVALRGIEPLGGSRRFPEYSQLRPIFAERTCNLGYQAFTVTPPNRIHRNRAGKHQGARPAVGRADFPNFRVPSIASTPPSGCGS